MATLRPYRNYDEKNVINQFSFSGTIPATAGTFVKIQRGFVDTDEPIEMLGSVGQSYNNVTSQRYGTYAKIATAGATDNVLGMMLNDVREVDENGELLKFNPRKAAEMGCVLSGQSVPVVSKGEFLYSGAVLASQTPVAHTKLYVISGELTTGYSTAALPGVTPATTGIVSQQVGIALGGKNSYGGVTIRLNIV